jgi:cell division protein FtsL
MLAIFQTKIVFNTILIVSIINLSILSIHWHHEMYLLHREEKTLKSENEKINALNRQLLMEYSEIQSGVNVYQKSMDELKMFAPIESEWEDVSI